MRREAYLVKKCNPFPVKLGDLEQPLRLQASENNKTLHGWLRMVLKKHLDRTKRNQQLKAKRNNKK